MIITRIFESSHAVFARSSFISKILDRVTELKSLLYRNRAQKKHYKERIDKALYLNSLFLSGKALMFLRLTGMVTG